MIAPDACAGKSLARVNVVSGGMPDLRNLPQGAAILTAGITVS
jgi:hypothetical protein